MKKDGIDLSKVDKEEFKDLFGEYDKEIFTNIDLMLKQNVNLDFLD